MIIYKATNVKNGKVYIGQTITSLENRRYHHEYRAFHSDINTKFCNSLRKHGAESFTWEVIDTAETRGELDEKEIEYISKYNSVNAGYNILLGGECSSRDGDQMAVCCGSKPFYAFTNKGKLIGEFINKRAFAREYDIPVTRVVEMIKGTTLSAKNIIVIDKETYTLEILNHRIANGIFKLEFEAIDKKTGESKGKFSSMEECKKILGLPRNCHIGEVLKGKRNSSNGYIFRYI